MEDPAEPYDLHSRRKANHTMNKNQNETDSWEVSETVDNAPLAPIPDAPAGLGEAPAKKRAPLQSDVRLRRMIAAALFAALAYLCVFVFRIQVAGFLTFDLKDAVMTIGALFLGPVAGVAIAAAVALLEMISVSTTGFYGFLMNFLASASFILPAAILYRLRRTRLSAILGLVLSAIFMTAMMIPLNLLITPLYTGASRSVVADLIPKTILPFNAVKGTLNAAVTVLLLQPVAKALHRVKLLPPEEEKNRVPAWVVPTVAGIVAVAAVLVFVLVLKGEFKVPFKN